MELEAMSRYTSPVNPAVFPHLTVLLLAIGMFFTVWFFVYEVISTKYTRDINKELLISLVVTLHGLWSPLPPALGWHLRMSSQGYPPGSFTKSLLL
ncbi:Transmembrane protein 258 [Microtus ochrogaster]|uniref:Dolichyl-diphosphooligosaccharide-protein glycosyltransferase subunit TMEM258 n=1 Tax=Microtus ochrogaster TaxID=79684 RepID=A0A8J6FZ56_MICOH|nr:Transmembrane protein 258 [Microtus ochrogaster]